MALSPEEKKKRDASNSKRHYYSHKENYAKKGAKWRLENKEYITTYQREAKRKRKAEAIEYLGGKCSSCLCTFHPAVYEFHHRDPAEKENHPSKLLGMRKGRLFAELDKCILLCANCHRLEHHKESYGKEEIQE